MTLSRCHTLANHDNMRQKDLSELYPHYDLFLKYGGLPCANHNVEGLFSHTNSVQAINMSDCRLDQKLHYQRNTLQPLKKEVLHHMEQKGCKVSRVTVSGSRDDCQCQMLAQLHKDILSSECVYVCARVRLVCAVCVFPDITMLKLGHVYVCRWISTQRFR